ncbi:MAG: hypothetical protein FD144_1382 [Rhodospirillaceae bacterium]|nr:MAG: hypothetical protein FD144_1382 [Rhodospirillaceae bacterium]
MKRSVLVLLAVLAVTSAAHADSGKRYVTNFGIAIAMSIVAELMVATEMCSLGDREEWQKVVAAYDRRYRFCVAQDPGWSSGNPEFEQAEAKAKAEGSDRSIASFTVEQALKKSRANAHMQGKAAFCAKMPWPLLLQPGPVTPEALALYEKAYRDPQLDMGLAAYSRLRKPAVDTAWVEAPCDHIWGKP